MSDALGPYEIERELGAGGMGTVYLARTTGGKRVALKVVHPHLVAAEQYLKRFEREVDLGRRVQHRNVVRTLDVGASEWKGATAHYLVTEYVEGRSLREILLELGTIPEALLREIGLQIAAGLEAIHAAGIVHRDLKPENVMLTDAQEIRIMDLGVAKLQEASVNLTEEGHFAGSFLYAAPEQFQGRAGPAADLYGLGVVLYELATGENPFRHDDTGAVIQAQLTTTPRRLAERNPDVSPFLSEIVATLMHKDPAKRFPSATALRGTFHAGEASDWWRERERRRDWATSQLPRIPGRAETALHGRARELESLREAWVRAKGGQGGVVLIEGEPGIGKTRLVAEFVRSLAGEEAHVLYGSYAAPGLNAGLSGSVVQHFGAGLEDALGRYLGATPALVPAFAAIVRHELPPADVAPLQSDALHACNCHLMRALAAERPTLWIIDDLHLAPAESMQIVLAMARAVESHRVLLVLTFRPDPEGSLSHQLPAADACRRIRLERLGAREVIDMLADAFRSELLAERLGGKVAHRSDGVPFFVVEMVRELKAGGPLQRAPDGTFLQTGPITDLEVPSAVKDLVEARLRELGSAERALLDLGAVHGFEFDPDLVARSRREPRVHVLQLLADLERRTGIVQAVGRSYRFDQNQIHEVVLAGVSQPLREEYHTMLAEAYLAQRAAGPDPQGEDAFFLAWHHLHGVRPTEGVPLLDDALDHLERTARYDLLLQLLDRALGLKGLLPDTRRLDLLLRRGRRLHGRGLTQEAQAALEEAVTLADAIGDPALASRSHFELASFLYYVARHEESLVQAQTSLDRALESGDRVLEMRACRGLGAAYYGLMRDVEAKQYAQRSLAMARELGDTANEASCLQNLGTLAMRVGALGEARELFEKAAAAAGTPESKALITYNLGILHHEGGRWQEAAVLLAEAVSLSEGSGSRRLEGLARQAQGHEYAFLGDWDTAEKHYLKALEILREVGNPNYIAWVLLLLGDVYLQQGRDADARATLNEALARAEETETRDYVLLARAQLTRLEPRTAPAVRELIRQKERPVRRGEQRALWYHLWEATGERSDLEAAYQQLQQALAVAPAEDREQMQTGHRLNRDILAAWRQAQEGDAD